MDEKSWWYETSYLTNELELVTLRWTWWELLYPTDLSTEAING